MSIKKCFSSNKNERLKELFDSTIDENIAAESAINKYYSELIDNLNTIEGITIPNNNIISLPTNQASKDIVLDKILSERTENAYRKFYNKIDILDDKYIGYLQNRAKESITTTEAKIKRLQQAFDATVLVDTSLQSSGTLLASNNPISIRNGKPTIVINPDLLFADTVFHEFGHLYIDLLGGIQDSTVQDAIEMLKGSNLWNQVEKNYPELSGENLSKEVLATALGIEGDILFKEDTEKKSIWNKLKTFILSLIKKLFNNKYDTNSIEQLASEMLSNTSRVSSTASFNSLVDQMSKFRIDNPTQENIDKFFKSMSDRYELDEETHKYKDKETGEIYSHSVSQFAKNISKGFSNSRKGSYDIDFDKGYELTKDNFLSIITQARLPYSLDKALDELFKGDIPAAKNLIITDKNKYWFTRYTSKENSEESIIQDLDNIIESNIDLINERAYKLQELKDIPLYAGNIIHDSIEDYIKNDQEFPKRIIDRSGKLLPTIKKIIDEGTKKGSKFYTEQMLFSQAAKKPGTADLIEITKEGKFKIYDYKTMASFDNYYGSKKNDYQMYVSNGYLNQILIYSTILEEYGLTPTDDYLNIIAIEIDRNSLDPQDENSELVITNLINKNIDPSDKNFNIHINKSKTKIVASFKAPDKLKDFNFKTEEKNINNLISKIQRGIQDYKKLTNENSDKFTNSSLGEGNIIKKIEDDINRLDEANNKVAILSYINNIREALFSVYDNSINKQDDITSDYLMNLNFILQASSFIKDVKELISSQQEDYKIDDKSKVELLDLLSETEVITKKVKDFSDQKTKELAVSSLAINSNFMQGIWKEKFEIEARQLGINKKQELEDYIYGKLKEKKDEIQTKEYEYWENLLNNGYTDIRPLEYFLADPGMNKSQFVQVVKNIIDKVDQDVRVDLDNETAELVKWYQDLTIEKTGNPKKVWSKFIEKGKYKDIDGKDHSYLDASVIPEFTSDYREKYIRYKQQLDYLNREIKKAIKTKNVKLENKLKDKASDIRNLRDKALGDNKLSKTQRVHPQFAKLSNEEKEALRFIHNKLEDADNRLFNAPYKKLIKETRDGNKIYNLPRKRQSHIESVYDKENTWKRFKSGFMDIIRPPKDEDELNITNEDIDEFDDFKTNATDILGDPLYDIPIYYRNELEDPNLQSFDIPSLLALNDETTIMYKHHKMIEADLFMIVNSLKNSNALKTDSIISNNVVDRLKGKLPKTLKANDNKTLKAVQASINNRFYKRSYEGIYSKTNYTAIKSAEALSKTTSAILLAGNFGSASMTGIQGSIYRLIEGAAGEDFNLNDVKKGSAKAWLDVNNIIADSQKQFPTSKTALLIRRFGLDTQYEALVNKFVQSNFITKNLDEATLFAITSIAETMVTANLMYTLMGNIKVMNNNGDYINQEGKTTDKNNAMSLDEAYKVEDGKLVLNKNVAFTERNLTSTFQNNIEGEKTIAATEISRFIRSKYADLYGQYNQDMKSVAEMHIAGKLMFSMRKWIPRGYHRRFRGLTSLNTSFDELKNDESLERRFFSQDQQKIQEGFYTTGLRYIVSLIKNMRDKKLSFAASMKDINTKLTSHERANLKRTGYEFGIIAISTAAALMLRASVLEMDDDDDKKDKVAFAAYLVERIKLESATFINPFELIENIKNPAAAVNTLDRISKLLWNLFGLSYDKDLGAYDFEIDNRFDQGPREGELKLYKNIQGLIPFYKKVSQAKGIIGLDNNESIVDSYEYLVR